MSDRGSSTVQAGDAELARAASRGAEAAFEELVRRHRGLIEFEVQRLYAPGLDRDDLRQEALLAVFEACGSFEPRRMVPFAAFAGLVVRRRVTSAVTAATRRKHELLSGALRSVSLEGGDQVAVELLAPAPRTCPVELLEERAQLRALGRAARSLTPLERSALGAILGGESYAAAAGRLGVSAKSVDNAVQRARQGLRKSLLQVAAGGPLSLAWCPRCTEAVAVYDDGRCVWCGAQTGGNVAEPVAFPGRCECGRPKSRAAMRCERCWHALMGRPEFRDPATGRMAATVPAESRVCACGAQKSYTARSCWACYLAAGGHRGRKHRSRPQKMNEATLLEARALYVSGLSVRQSAARIFERTEYASVASCAMGLFTAFEARGWKLRDRKAASAAGQKLAARRLPRCRFVKASGKRCERHTRHTTRVCWHHRPENMVARLEELHRAEDVGARFSHAALREAV